MRLILDPISREIVVVFHVAVEVESTVRIAEAPGLLRKRVRGERKSEKLLHLSATVARIEWGLPLVLNYNVVDSEVLGIGNGFNEEYHIEIGG